MNTNNGWKLVPVEPTSEMWAAVNKLDDEMAAGAYDGKGASIEQVWNCLVETAPEAPPLTVTVDPDARGVSVGVYQGPRCVYNGAHPIPTGATGDTQMAGELMPKLQSLLDRMANDPRTGDMFEADGDTLRDAMHLCRSVKVCAAIGAPAAGDALDAARYRNFRAALSSLDTTWLDKVQAALEAMGLDPDDDVLPTAEQVDAAFDAAIAQQSQRKEA